MAAQLQELQDKRNKLAGDIKQHADKFNDNNKQWPNAESKENWDKLNADYDAVVKEMDDIKAADSVSARLNLVNQLQADPTNPVGPVPGRDDGTPGMLGGRRIGGDGEETCTDQHLSLIHI